MIFVGLFSIGLHKLSDKIFMFESPYLFIFHLKFMLKL